MSQDERIHNFTTDECCLRRSTHSPAAEFPARTASKNEVASRSVGYLGLMGYSAVSFAALSSTIRLFSVGHLVRRVLLLLLLLLLSLAVVVMMVMLCCVVLL